MEMEELQRLKYEFGEVYKILNNRRLKINASIESTEREMGKRELKKKEIMLRELKMVLRLLNETETNMIKDLKNEAFDKLHIASQLAENSRILRDEVAFAERKNDFQNISKWKENLKAMKNKIADIDLDFLESCLTIKVTGSSSGAEYESLRSQYRDLITHSAGCLSPKNFVASLADLSVPSQGRLQFSILHVDKAFLKQHFVLEKLKVIVSSPARSSTGGKIIYEECSVLDKIRTKQAIVVEEQGVGFVRVTIKQQKHPVEISVKMFDSNISGSPRSLAAPLLCLATDGAKGSIPLSDDLDQSDINSLDLTGRLVLNSNRRPALPTQSLPSQLPLTVPRTVEEERAGSVIRARPKLQDGVGGGPKSILKQRTLTEPPDSASNSPITPRVQGTIISDAVRKLNGGMENTRSILSNSPIIGTIQTEKEEEDPDLYLNESKALSPTTLRKTIVEDSREEGESRKEDCHNVSMLPDMDQMDNDSSWEELEIVRFNFAVGKLEEVGRLEPQLTSVSSSRGEVRCLERPESVALLPSRNLILVSEPLRDRIGLYWANSLRFASWFQFPRNDERSKKSFVQPTSLLAREDLLVIIDSEEIFVFNIMDNACKLVFSQSGKFHGLASSSKEEFYSVLKDAERTFLVSFSRVGANDWKMLQRIPVDPSKTSDTSSDIRFLTVAGDKIFMSDQASHRLIQVDLKTQAMRLGGYMGHHSGQIYQPAGLLADDAGNILVCDAGNNRLALFNEELQHVKDINDCYQQRPRSLLREGKFVYLVLQDQDSPAVIKMKLSVAGVDSEETSPETSDRE